MVSHNLNDVFAVADRIVVLRLGRTVASGEASGFDSQSAVELMTTGRSSREGVGSGAGGVRESAKAAMLGLREEQPPEGGRSALVSAGAVQTFGDYAQGLWSRVRAGESGVLPVVLGAALIAGIFQAQNADFL